MTKFATVPETENDPVRKEKLRRLDALLAWVEALNEKGVKTIPEDLAAALDQVGIRCTESMTPRKLIKQVWKVQATLLHQLPDDRKMPRQPTFFPDSPPYN